MVMNFLISYCHGHLMTFSMKIISRTRFAFLSLPIYAFMGQEICVIYSGFITSISAVFDTLIGWFKLYDMLVICSSFDIVCNTQDTTYLGGRGRLFVKTNCCP